VGKTLENGTETSYAYDNASRLTQMKHAKGITTLAQFDYTLDSVGNRTQKAATGSIPNRTEDCDYDAVDQVASADYGGRAETFHYDGVGNRTSVADSSAGTTSYTANSLNQYTAVGGGGASHDANGNLTAINGWTYACDSKNRLLSATDGTTTATFAYDFRNRQVSRTINGATTYFVWEDWNLIEERDGAGNLVQKYYHGAATDELLARIDPGGVIYYHQDGLGSTVALTDDGGNLVESCQYDVFGKATIHDGSGSMITATAYGNRFLFTGREWIKEVGLYDYRNRVYSQELGRFLQIDPIRFEAGDVNLYRYVANNPINLWDPFGLCPDDPLLQDAKVQDLVNKIWDKSTPFGLSDIGWFGAREHYGFIGSSNGSTTTSGPFPARTSMGGYQPRHQKADPAGTVAGVHSHWTNNPNPSKEDKGAASTRGRPEYIVNKDGITRVNPDGTSNTFNRDGTASNCKCP
jgi:RHS repeat-associated protein